MLVNIEHTNDFRDIAKLNETVQNWHHKKYPNDFKLFDLNKMELAFKNILESENTLALIAKNQNKPIGYLLAYVKVRPDSAFQYEKTILTIDQISVTPAYQNLGVGQSLMDRVYKYAQDQQIAEIQLDHWAGNKSAEHFFLKNGFENFNYHMRKSLLINQSNNSTYTE